MACPSRKVWLSTHSHIICQLLVGGGCPQMPLNPNPVDCCKGMAPLGNQISNISQDETGRCSPGPTSQSKPYFPQTSASPRAVPFNPRVSNQTHSFPPVSTDRLLFSEEFNPKDIIIENVPRIKTVWLSNLEFLPCCCPFPTSQLLYQLPSPPDQKFLSL